MYCRHINPHLFQFKFKYEDGSTARKIFKKGDDIFSFDLKSAYHHISIYKSHRTYFGFHWGSKYYVFNVLAFGLSTAGFIFSILVREIIKFWRSKHLRVVAYLNDGIGGAETFENAFKDSKSIKADLSKFGFISAEEKFQ